MLKKFTILIITAIISLIDTSCFAQNKLTMSDQKNPLLCNPESGICEVTPVLNEQNNITPANQKSSKSIRIIYYTDPICSSCWGIEPQLRKLKLEYGALIDIEYKMGGLLPDWSYNSGGISKPSDVAHHWDEVSVYYDMPIDGDVWLEDPLSSSYPPSIAFKAAQMQDTQKALAFLRLLREAVFLQKKNITKWEHLQAAAQQAGLDVNQFKADYEGKAKENFQEDLDKAKELGVRGFPTVFFINNENENTEKVYGSKPYSSFEQAIQKLQNNAVKNSYNKDWEHIFKAYPTSTAREYAELAEMPRAESEALLNKLTAQGKLSKFSTKNGAIWTLK